MKFFDLQKSKPKNGQWCVVKEPIKTANGIVLYVFGQQQPFYDDAGFEGHSNVKKWAPFPDHVSINPAGWKSEYRGDELPSKNCNCLVSWGDKEIVSICYFDAKRQKFLGRENVIAFMEI